MIRLLFVCLGNICRSCTAEEIFRVKAAQHHASEQFSVDSAGIIDYHKGELPDHRMRRIARSYGYELTHRSRPITPDDFSRFDKIVAMDDRNYDKLCRLAQTDEERSRVVRMIDYLPQGSTWQHLNHVPDPYYGDEADFRLVVELLELTCETMLNDLLEPSTSKRL